MKQETQAYNKYITNPFNTLPKTMPQNHAQRSLTEFLKNNRDMITPNRTDHLIVDGEKISEDPHDVGRIIHYLTRDIRGPAPKGVGHIIRALRKRGFDINNDLGNAFLKKKIKRRAERAKIAESSGISSASPATTNTPSTASPAIRPRSSSGPPALRRGRRDDDDDGDDDDDDYGETPKTRKKKRRYQPSSTIQLDLRQAIGEMIYQ